MVSIFIFMTTLLLMGESLLSTIVVIFTGLILCLCESTIYNQGTNMFIFENAWSWSLSLLSLFIMLMIILTQSYIFFSSGRKWKSSITNTMAIALMGCFWVSKLLMFYIFFELSALMIFFFILSFGYQPERFVASLYLLLFTAITSLPLLGVLLYLNNMFQINSFLLLSVNHWESASPKSDALFFFLSLGFLVKFPIYFFHIWLPKAHVEASASGSMLLAGVLLKLGSYGLYRVSSLITSPCYFLVFFCLLGGSLLSILCIRMTDFKVMIAYSSVVHMSLVAVGLLGQNNLGEVSALGMSLGHGIVSSGLFFGAGVLYSKSNSRLMLFNKGILNWSPWMGLFWFMLCAFNMGTPPSYNFWMELSLFFSLLGITIDTMLLVGVMLFFGVVFNLLLFSMVHNQKSEYYNMFSLELSKKEILIFLAHLFLATYMFFFMFLFK